MTRAVCPGSYDPVTNGHLDIIGRAAALYDEIVVAVGRNSTKARLFDLDERLALLRAVTADLPGVTVAAFDGLLVQFCREAGIDVIVKGVRGAADVEYEVQMAHMNRRLAGIETFFVPADTRYSFLSSSLVREVASHGGDVGGFVPAQVAARLSERMAQQNGE